MLLLRTSVPTFILLPTPSLRSNDLNLSFKARNWLLLLLFEKARRKGEEGSSTTQCRSTVETAAMMINSLFITSLNNVTYTTSPPTCTLPTSSTRGFTKAAAKTPPGSQSF